MHRITVIVLLVTALLAGSAFAGDWEDSSRHFEFTYNVTVPGIPAAAGTALAWVPLAQSGYYQDILSVSVEGGYPYRIVTEPDYLNSFLLVDLAGAKGGDASFSVVYDVVRRDVNALQGFAAPLGNPKLLARLLAPDSMVPLDGEVAAEAVEVVGDASDTLGVARALYDHVVTTLDYDKSGEGWGRGDALYACDVRAGNCTDFHSLFIGEARSLGIPARFIMGVPLPRDGSAAGEIGGYHCWAEFYLEGTGWVPVDCSEASKDKSRTDELFGGLDCDRVQFTMGRDVLLPESAVGRVNFIIYPYVEVDCASFPAQKAFSFKNL